MIWDTLGYATCTINILYLNFEKVTAFTSYYPLSSSQFLWLCACSVLWLLRMVELCAWIFVINPRTTWPDISWENIPLCFLLHFLGVSYPPVSASQIPRTAGVCCCLCLFVHAHFIARSLFSIESCTSPLSRMEVQPVYSVLWVCPHITVCVCTHRDMCVCAYKCVCIQVCIYAYRCVHTVYMCVHTGIQVCVYTGVGEHTSVCVYIQVCVHTGMCAYRGVCVHTDVCVHTGIWVHTGICLCVHVGIHVCAYKYMCVRVCHFLYGCRVWSTSPCTCMLRTLLAKSFP